MLDEASQVLVNEYLGVMNEARNETDITKTSSKDDEEVQGGTFNFNGHEEVYEYYKDDGPAYIDSENVRDHFDLREFEEEEDDDRSSSCVSETASLESHVQEFLDEMNPSEIEAFEGHQPYGKATEDIYTNTNGFCTKGEVVMSSRYKGFVKEKKRRSKSARVVQDRVANVNFIPKKTVLARGLQKAKQRLKKIRYGLDVILVEMTGTKYIEPYKELIKEWVEEGNRRSDMKWSAAKMQEHIVLDNPCKFKIPSTHETQLFINSTLQQAKQSSQNGNRRPRNAIEE